MKIRFPNQGQKYYDTHYKFIDQIFRAAGLEVEYYKAEPLDDVRFEMYIDDKPIIMDFSDHKALYPLKKSRDYHRYYKFHCPNVEPDKLVVHTTIPFSPISFYDWGLTYRLFRSIAYTCNNDIILNNQVPGAAALKRRQEVQKILAATYGEHFDTGMIPQLQYWRKIDNCLVSVCIPGARNDILDRGQWQYMAFGACTISPKLDIVLPEYTAPEPGIHYIECKPDYSNLVELIEWCKTNRKECVDIGQNAKALFASTSTPAALIRWLEKTI